jgi:hypothetical protein
MTRRAALVAFVLVVLTAAAQPVAAQMPDPRMMSGQIMPAPELAAGTITVRIIRQAIMNVIPGVDVELHGAGDVRHATSGSDGRAVFTSVPAGAHVHAVAVVDNERLTSIEFDMPPAGGVRTILAAGVGVGTPVGGTATAAGGSTAPNAPSAPSAPSAPATPGSLVLAGDTRFAAEFQEDTLTVFYLLDIVNRARQPVMPASPLVIDLPAGASGAALLEGGSPLAVVKGSRATISGPLPPGVTQVPIAFRLETWADPWVLEQTFPLAIENVAVAIQKLGDMRLQSAQTPTVRETRLQGTPFIVATGSSLPAGTALAVSVSGVPHRSRWPVYLTLAFAVAIALWGAWVASSGLADDKQLAARRKELEARRSRGLAALAALDAQRRDGTVDEARFGQRRAQLLDQLERVYGELDGGGDLPGGGQGLAA